jgi:hypothetical protein
MEADANKKCDYGMKKTLEVESEKGGVREMENNKSRWKSSGSSQSV